MNENESTTPPEEPTDATGAPGESTAAPSGEAGPSATASPAFPTPIKRKRGRLVALVAGASVLAIGGTGVGVAAAVEFADYTSRSTTTTAQNSDGDTTNGFGQGTQGGFSFGNGYGQSTLPDQSGGTQGGTSDGTDSGTQSSTGTTATDDQQQGVVLIDTELKYLGGEAAGTGIVLTSNGEILTNNHVVEGSTSVSVTIASTGVKYTAKVVGTDATNDIAVLQLENASGLATADLDSSGSVALGDTVTGVGNAEGQGYLSAATGSVTALDQQITVADDVTGASKTLDGLIETDAGIVSGDSGGPLYDADGQVVGIDTAASANTQEPTGYAIPIADALKIADRIEAGDESGTVELGYPAFLGVELATGATTTETTPGATIADAIDGTPAADAGLAAGDTITSVDGAAIATGAQLTKKIASYEPGDSVKVGYTDAEGTSHTVTVTLVQGPAR